MDNYEWFNRILIDTAIWKVIVLIPYSTNVTKSEILPHHWLMSLAMNLPALCDT